MRLVVAMTGASGAVPGIHTVPATVEEMTDTIVAGVLDQLGVAVPGTPRWAGAEPPLGLIKQADVY